MSNEIIAFAHDVKNSLSIIKLGLAQIKKITSEDSPIYKKATTCLNQVDLCASYCNSKLLERKETVSLKSLLEDCQKDIKNSFNSIEFRTVTFEDRKVTVDCSQFKNFILNLVKNAHEANSTSVSFYIRGKRLVIIDNGVGFPEVIMKNSPQELPTGLRGHGLSSMRSFCESNGWSIALMNNDESPNSGSRIVLFFE